MTRQEIDTIKAVTTDHLKMAAEAEAEAAHLTEMATILKARAASLEATVERELAQQREAEAGTGDVKEFANTP
jgi:hypothetical protein